MEARLTHIDRRETLRYLGYHGGRLTEDVREALDRCEALLLKTARPRAVWRRFALLPDGTLAGTRFRPAGEDIRAHLAGCSHAILMAATLGGEAERLVRGAQARSMADALVLDACASAAVENVCDNLCEDIQRAVAPEHLTDRFSPGYGDLPLSQQAALFGALDVTRRIGVTLSDGGLMLPQKSVTAILGVSPVPVAKRPRGCAACGLSEDCPYRNEGNTCEAK